MGKFTKKTYGPSDKAIVALEALKGTLTLNEITKKYGVHATQINKWKKDLYFQINIQILENIFRIIGVIKIIFNSNQNTPVINFTGVIRS